MEKAKKYIVGFLIAAVYIGTIILAIMTGFGATAVLEEIQEAQETDFIGSNSYKIASCCQMPGCDRRTTNICSYSLSYGMRWFSHLSIENKANFTVETGTHEFHDTKTYTKKDKALVIRPVGNGNYVASIEEYVKDTHTYEGDKHIKHYTAITGFYCDQHKTMAITIAKEELEKAVKTTFPYIWGRMLFPWNLMVFSWVVAFIRGYKAYDNMVEVDRANIKRAICKDGIPIMIIVLVFTLLGCLVMGYLFLALFSIVIIAVGIFICNPLGTLFHCFRKDRSLQRKRVLNSKE